MEPAIIDFDFICISKIIGNCETRDARSQS